MISEHLKACDELISNTQRVVDELKALPDTKVNIRAVLRAEDLLATTKRYKEEAMALYDVIFEVMRH